MNEVRTITPEAEPHSVEAEQMILGALLLGRSSSAVQAEGGADIFYDPVHAEIYRTCRRLEKADKLVSPVTVKASLSEALEEALKELGGAAYLARLAGSAVAPSEIAEYASLVAEQSAKRHLLEVMRNAQAELAHGERSASDVAAQMEAGFSALSSGASSVKPVSIMAAVTEAMTDIHAAQTGQERKLVRPGVSALERFAPGFEPGEMWLIGGRPSMGKTAVALSFGLNAARAGHHVVIASLEMTPKAMAMRALSEGSSRQREAAKYSQMRSGRMSAQQMDALVAAARDVSELPITFLPREYQDADLLQVGVKQALRHVDGDRPPLVIVDYAQLMRSKARSRYEQITDISLALKGLAMSLGVPVVALSQLSRNLESREDKRPMLSDLRESGQLEQDADGVIFCFREEYYTEREEPDLSDIEAHGLWREAMEKQRNRLELIVAKQRQGPVGTAHVRFNPAINLIWE